MPRELKEPDGVIEIKPSSPADSSDINIVRTVVNLTSLGANAGAPARFTNASSGNVVSNINQATQNAIANQQTVSQLGTSILGKTINRVQNLNPAEARSSLLVLTNNELAQTIADLRAVVAGGRPRPPLPPFPPFRWKRLLDLLMRILADVQKIEEVNNRLSGDGSLNNPFQVTGQPLYVKAETTIGFPNLDPSKLDVSVLEKMFLEK